MNTEKTNVFIDGCSGTTGLRIAERLQIRDDIELIVLDDAERHSEKRRAEAINASDITFLCLPDAAAVQAVGMVKNPDTVIIDASTAHRTKAGWVYGFPELSQKQAELIAKSKRIAAPGCHASGFTALAAPLTRAGIIPKGALLTCFSLTGYSGGGRSMIADYEKEERSPLLGAPRQYGLGQQHKHLAEMQAMCLLDAPPAFCPIVADFYSGMEVTVPVFASQLCGGASAADIAAVYAETYNGPIVSFDAELCSGGFLSACMMSGKDSMRLTVCGCGERILLAAVYDNLGKGASGAAIECMNIVMGCDITSGLSL